MPRHFFQGPISKAHPACSSPHTSSSVCGYFAGHLIHWINCFPASILESLHLADHGRIHAAIFCAPLVNCRNALSMFAAQFRHGNATFRLTQDRKNLLLSKSARLHQNIPGHNAEMASDGSVRVDLLRVLNGPLCSLAQLCCRHSHTWVLPLSLEEYYGSANATQPDESGRCHCWTKRCVP